MTPEKLARIQTHLNGEHPQIVMDAALWELIKDAESPSGVMDAQPNRGVVPGVSGVRLVAAPNHASDGDVSSTKKMSSPRAPGVVATDGRAPRGGSLQRATHPIDFCAFSEALRRWRDESSRSPVCLFGPGGDFQTPWPPCTLSPPSQPGARSDARAPGGGETDDA